MSNLEAKIKNIKEAIHFTQCVIDAHKSFVNHDCSYPADLERLNKKLEDLTRHSQNSKA